LHRAYQSHLHGIYYDPEKSRFYMTSDVMRVNIRDIKIVTTRFWSLDMLCLGHGDDLSMDDKIDRAFPHLWRLWDIEPALMAAYNFYCYYLANREKPQRLLS